MAFVRNTDSWTLLTQRCAGPPHSWLTVSRRFSCMLKFEHYGCGILSWPHLEIPRKIIFAKWDGILSFLAHCPGSASSSLAKCEIRYFR